MGRNQRVNVPAGTLSNPYHKGKEKVGVDTHCETCDRTFKSRDWSAHSTSKVHLSKKAAIENKENVKTNTDGTNGTGTWGGDASGFTPDAGFDLASPNAGDGGWGLSGSGGNNNNNNNNNNSGGGGGRACFNCGLEGHRKTDCPEPLKPRAGGGGGDQACFKCGEVGHRKSGCPQGGSGGGGQACFNCGNEGHRKNECPEPVKPRAGGGGGGRACFNCLQPGHNSSECPEPRVERCRNCDAEGHMSRECPKPKDWSRVKCTNCSKYGHGKMRCPEPEANGDSYGGGGNGWDAPTDSGATTGGWDNAAVEPATTDGWAGDDRGGNGGTGESWADQATAEAQW